jgi:dephospho-CoA kinase
MTESRSRAASGTSIAITGHISAGKSTLIRELAARHPWSVISFGEYVRSVARQRSLPTDRKSLQELGYDLFRSLGAKAFTDTVIAHSAPLSNVWLLDGVRDAAIVAALRQEHATTMVIFLDVPARMRYERHVARMNLEETVFTFADFLNLEAHPIEQGTDGLRTIADDVIEVRGEPVAEVLGEIEHRLRQRRIL